MCIHMYMPHAFVWFCFEKYVILFCVWYHMDSSARRSFDIDDLIEFLPITSKNIRKSSDLTRIWCLFSNVHRAHLHAGAHATPILVIRSCFSRGPPPTPQLASLYFCLFVCFFAPLLLCLLACLFLLVPFCCFSVCFLVSLLALCFWVLKYFVVV